MKIKIYIFSIVAFFLITSCMSSVENAQRKDALPEIYPDYVGVTIPVDIAPMNFSMLDESCECVDVIVRGSKGGEMHVQGKFADFDIDEWHELTEQNKGGELTFTVSALSSSAESAGKWIQYKDFKMYVSENALDEWGLTYRRVAPGYEVYSQMGLYQRDLSNFDEYEILQTSRTPGECVNCHTSNRTNPKEFLFHIRGAHGATVMQKNGEMELLDTKVEGVLGACVYPYWHPEGRYVVFSTNTTRQSFHVVKDERIEVFDHESDLQVYDTEKHQLILSPLVTKDEYNETFPAFSPDGKTIYFCSAQKREYPKDSKIVRYNLNSIAFDSQKAEWGDSIFTLVDADADSMSVSIPKPSYDGKWLMYTLAKYGTFPIWHKEADLWLLNLSTGEKRALTEVNSNDTESYHNWSDNSRWFVFSSRRGDGLYTRLYLSSFGENGKATKPFLLPQRNPRKYYERLMYSYNVPDFTKSKVDFDARKAASECLDGGRSQITKR